MKKVGNFRKMNKLKKIKKQCSIFEFFKIGVCSSMYNALERSEVKTNCFKKKNESNNKMQWSDIFLVIFFQPGNLIYFLNIFFQTNNSFFIDCRFFFSEKLIILPDNLEKVEFFKENFNNFLLLVYLPSENQSIRNRNLFQKTISLIFAFSRLPS